MKYAKAPSTRFPYSDGIESGMLSAAQIKYYVTEHEIIKGESPHCYGAATYHMRLGHHAVRWVGGKKEEIFLEEKTINGVKAVDQLELQPNSLTFVTTCEQFDLPRHIIARFNLKSKWVHRGVLLGTGPIVDPEFTGTLFIPLHNFSSQTIRIDYKAELISVEFTKTLDPDQKLVSPEYPSEVCTDYCYVDNRNAKSNFSEYQKKLDISSIESSVSAEFQKYDESHKEFEKAAEKLSAVGRFSMIGAAVAMLTLLITTLMFWDIALDKLDKASSLIQHAEKLGVDADNFALTTDVTDLRSELSDLKKKKLRSLQLKNNSLQQELLWVKKDNAKLKIQLKEIKGSLSQLQVLAPKDNDE